MKTLTSKSISLHLATNRYDLSHYGYEIEPLRSAEKDFNDFRLISLYGGLELHYLTDENLTKFNLEQAVQKAAKTLKPNDFFFLTFTGFGSSVQRYIPSNHDISLPSWCLYDGQVLCKEIENMLSVFQQGVKILVISDCSHYNNNNNFSSLKMDGWRERALPIELAEHTYLRNKDQYDGLTLQIDDNLEILPSILWISACQINQIAYENNYNGLLTSAIKHVWRGGNFKGDYSSFFNEISLRMPPIQSPKIALLGQDTARLLKMKPFAN